MENRESMTPSEKAVADVEESLQEAVDADPDLAKSIKERSRTASVTPEELDTSIGNEDGESVKEEEDGTK